jgi:HlyD family secretion protein
MAAAGAGAWWWHTHPGQDGNRIFVSGNLELTQVDISFKIAGRMTERKVDEGDWVKKGDLIARLDPVQLQQQRGRDRAIVISAQSNYEQLKTSIEFQRATLESDVAARRAELDQAQDKLDALLNGSRKQDIQQAEAAVTDAKAQMEFARLGLGPRMQTLYKNEDISTQQYDQYRTKFDSAHGDAAPGRREATRW